MSRSRALVFGFGAFLLLVIIAFAWGPPRNSPLGYTVSSETTSADDTIDDEGFESPKVEAVPKTLRNSDESENAFIASVSEILRDLKIETQDAQKYSAILVKNGYTDRAKLQVIRRDSLKEMGITKQFVVDAILSLQGNAEGVTDSKQTSKNEESPKTGDTSAKGESGIPFLYKVKDPRPLSQVTVLKGDASLWLYPENQRKLLPGDLNGPWHSQVRQDQMLYTGFFRNHFNGTFVELGAVDGVTLSNTKFFQEQMGWGGVLIEPSEDYEYLIAGTQKYSEPPGKFTGKRCVNQPPVHCINAAVCQREGTLKMVRAGSAAGNMAGGALDFISEKHKKEAQIRASDSYEVPCRPFGIILNEVGIKHIDLLSLDVEGAEETVLETMDWSIPVHVIVVEAHVRNSPTGPEGHERKHRILLENGFKFMMKYRMDEWWVNPSNSRVKLS